MRLLIVSVFLLGLVSCGEEKKSSSSSSSSDNKKEEKESKWSKEEKEQCIDSRKEKLKDNFQIQSVYKLSNDEIAECTCNALEEKFESYKDSEKEMDDKKDPSTIGYVGSSLLKNCTNDKSVKGKWSNEIKTLTSLAWGKKNSSCIINKLENRYNNLFEAIQDFENSSVIIGSCIERD